MHAIIFNDQDGNWPTIKQVSLDEIRNLVSSVKTTQDASWEDMLEEGDLPNTEHDESHLAAVLTIATYVNLETGEYTGDVAETVRISYSCLEEDGWIAFIGNTKANVCIHMADYFTTKAK